MATEKTCVERASYIWNASYAGLSAVQSAVLLLAISRTHDLRDAGIVTIAFTLGNLAMMIANYGIRNFQVTDVQEQYVFSDYYYVRLVTIASALILALMYLTILLFLGRYSLHKSLIILAVIVFKLTDSMENVFVGRLQQKGRLDIGSRIAAIRLFISTFVTFLIIFFIEDLWICFLIGTLVSVIVDVLWLPKERVWADFTVTHVNPQRLRELLRMGFVLCAGTVLHNYIGNAPKYLVDLLLVDETQAISGYVMMPMFVITVLNQFLMQPTVKKLGDAWQEGNIRMLYGLIARQIKLLLVISLFVMAGGIWIGLPMLSWMYRINLSLYRQEFAALMIGGTLYTLSAYLLVVLTAMRKPMVIVYGCIAALALYFILGVCLAIASDFLRICKLYCIVNIIVFIFFIIGTFSCNDQKSS